MENLSRSHFAHDMLPHSVRRVSIARRFLHREVFSGGQRLVQSTAHSIRPRCTATFRHHNLPSAEPRSSPSRPISTPISMEPLRRCHRSVRIDTSMHTDSNYRAASFVYGLADSSLMMGQRILLCVLVCLGCDIYMPRARMESSRGFTLSSMVIRIARNFYFILRGLRKWLAINFNDGIIPVPAVQPIRRVRAHRSTPRRDAVPHDYLADMARLHSPVRPCYIGSDEPIPLFRLLAGAAPSKLNLNHSDPLSMSSSMSDIMSSLVEAFTGCLVDPEVATEEVDEDGRYNDEVELKSFNCSSRDSLDS
uniref:Bestrophin homolog n=1 Tax=Panagrellus redivivus TaxID=6233 RepID=A0A7E4W5F6_PANRE